MTLPIRRPLNDYALGPFDIALIDAASAALYVHPVPFAGQIIAMHLSMLDAITGTNFSAITVEKNGVAMTGITMDVGIGDALAVTSAEFGPNLVTGAVAEGDCIEVKTDGGCDDGTLASVYLIIRR